MTPLLKEGEDVPSTSEFGPFHHPPPPLLTFSPKNNFNVLYLLVHVSTVVIFVSAPFPAPKIQKHYWGLEK